MYKTFRCTTADMQWETGVLALSYAFDDALHFTERYQFSISRNLDEHEKHKILRLARQLHIAAGVSYYKAFCPNEMIVESSPLTKEDIEFWMNFYVHGLGEFYYRNNLSVKGSLSSMRSTMGESEDEVHQELAPSVAVLHPLVPIGGGKDSSVTAEMMRDADIAFSAFVMGKNEKILAAAAKTGAPIVQVLRTLDEEFISLVKEGKVSYNGHVPITGILSFVALIAAVINKNDAVVMSNEASASFGNVTIDGIEVNHQWSKSIAFERAFQEHLVRHGMVSPVYFSALRPFSELRIVKKFAELKKYHDVATSCNANFSITKQAEKRWCGECPKCAFVFVTLGAFLPENDLVHIFGMNMFANETLVPLFGELLGRGMKPFECVGEPDEVRAACFLMHKEKKFVGTPVMEMFVQDVLASIEDGDALVKKVLETKKEHCIPKQYAERLLAKEL